MRTYNLSVVLRRALAIGISLAGCGQSNEVGISITGLNYTDEYISSFVVNGYDGANIFPHGGGGSYVCCVTVPRRWHPGLKVTVRWTKDYRDELNWKQKVVDIPEYKPDALGFLAAHFYPSDIVKVLVTTKNNQFLGYPYPDPIVITKNGH